MQPSYNMLDSQPYKGAGQEYSKAVALRSIHIEREWQARAGIARVSLGRIILIFNSDMHSKLEPHSSLYYLDLIELCETRSRSRSGYRSVVGRPLVWVRTTLPLLVTNKPQSWCRQVSHSDDSEDLAQTAR